MGAAWLIVHYYCTCESIAVGCCRFVSCMQACGGVYCLMQCCTDSRGLSLIGIGVTWRIDSLCIMLGEFAIV